MPTYDFLNQKTGLVFTEVMTIADKDPKTESNQSARLNPAASTTMGSFL